MSLWLKYTKLPVLSLFLALLACSGGDGGSSSGSNNVVDAQNTSSRSDDTSGTSNQDTSNRLALSEVEGDYNGDITIDDTFDSIAFNMTITNGGVIRVNIADSSIDGEYRDGSFLDVAGTMDFIVNGQSCTGPVTFSSTLVTNTSIQGNFESQPICDSGPINADGTFTATKR